MIKTDNMDKIVGTWRVDNGQSFSYSKDATFTAQVPFGGTISGRYAFHNGYYILESGGAILSAFQILFYDETSMRVGMNTGEIHFCQRVGNQDTSDSDKDWLKPGSQVVLHSLKGSASLNGGGGVIRSFDKASSRYVVFVEQTKVEMKIREGNLKPPPAPAASKNPYMHSASKNPYMQNNAFNNNDPLAQMNQQTAQLNQQNEQMLQQLNQQTAQMNQQNALLMSRLGQQTAQMTASLNQQMAQMNHATPQMYGGGSGNMNGFQPHMYGGGQQMYGGGGFGNMNGFQPQMYGGGGGNNGGKKPSKLWNAVKEGASQVDPAAAGEFVGAAAGEFVQGTGFDVSGLGGLFGF